MIPDKDAIRDLLEKQKVPSHILEHQEVVCRVALALARALRKAGYPVDLGLVEASALLHDICKMDGIATGQDHAGMAEEVLVRAGYPEVACVVGQHVRLRSFRLDEAMVVNYADKRVMHAQVVTLEERFKDLMERYGTDEARRARIREHASACEEMERIIAGAIGAGVQELEGLCLVPLDETVDGL
ncbi:MAG TPA: HD domain-containing protein [Deltaproteobacteria bacterium]|mgnify:CR=1 FL=1|nr:HD domain-containing protein [Deltaproteobacteria bacterium]HPP80096.1 HD domain-containing protein [Deltaproteobacteria bacterium]